MKSPKLKIALGVTVGLGVFTIAMNSLATASVPSRSRVTDDTALYQNLSEIRVPREKTPSFESDISRLSALERRFPERIAARPNPLSAPMQRISQRKYRYSRSEPNLETVSNPIPLPIPSQVPSQNAGKVGSK